MMSRDIGEMLQGAWVCQVDTHFTTPPRPEWELLSENKNDEMNNNILQNEVKTVVL